MKTLLHSSFLWLLAGGFALGAAGLAAFHPVEVAAPTGVDDAAAEMNRRVDAILAKRRWLLNKGLLT